MRRRALMAASMQGGGGGEYGEEIAFYFDSRPYGGLYELKALDGMTWADWISSQYNTMGVEMGDTYGDVYWMDLTIVYYDTGKRAKSEDLIINECTYGV